MRALSKLDNFVRIRPSEQKIYKTQGKRKCGFCLEIYDLSEFYARTTVSSRTGKQYYTYYSVCKTCWKERANKIYTPKYRRAVKDGEYKRQYGISLDDFESLKERQNHRCAICNTLEKGGLRNSTELVPDHSHITGQFRGVICRNCNLGLGYFKDNLELLINAQKYLGGN